MYTSLAFVAFTHLMALPSSPSWYDDYWRAQKQVQLVQRPLAVFVGTGQTGHHRDSLSPEVQTLLARQYVCVFLDTSTQSGQELARDFNITKGSGLVISDRTGTLQALHHDGALPSGELERQLQRFANPALAVQTTESNARTSYYSGYPQGYQSYPSFRPVMSGRGC
jgi:hypothetical protein